MFLHNILYYGFFSLYLYSQTSFTAYNFRFISYLAVTHQ